MSFLEFIKPKCPECENTRVKLMRTAGGKAYFRVCPFCNATVYRKKRRKFGDEKY